MTHLGILDDMEHEAKCSYDAEYLRSMTGGQMSEIPAGKADLKTIANGLFPARMDPKDLTPEGRDEVRDAVDAILRMSDYRNTKLTLALEQLGKACDKIEKFRVVLREIESFLDDQADADDGRPNDAMRLLTEVRDALRI